MSVERLLEEKRRVELAARIASGEFTVEQSGFLPQLRNGLMKLGVPTEILGASEDSKVKGAISAIRSQSFFIPLYELYLTYGGIFRLAFGPKGILAETLDFVMGKGLIPADGEIWSV